MAKSLALLAAAASLCQGFAPAASTTRRTALFSYLDSLNGAAAAQPSYQTSSAPPAASGTDNSGSTGFCHAPLDYFSFDKLSGKGPRATFDWGTPEDFSRGVSTTLVHAKITITR